MLKNSLGCFQFGTVQILKDDIGADQKKYVKYFNSILLPFLSTNFQEKNFFV